MVIKLLKVGEISKDRDVQIRDGLDQEKIAEYAEAMEAGDKFPRLVVFFDRATYWLASGYHRFEAARIAGHTEIECDVQDGQKRDAAFFALSDNKHGVHLTSQEKRRAVERMLADVEWSKLSDRQIARHIGVSNWLVSNARRGECENLTQPEPKSVIKSQSGAISPVDPARLETLRVQSVPERQPTIRELERDRVEHESAAELAARTDAVAVKPFSLPHYDKQSLKNLEEKRVSPTSLELAERARDDAMEQLDDIRTTAAELEAEVQAYRAAEIGEGEKALVAASKRILKLEAEVRRMASIRDGLMNQNAELMREVKRLRRQLERGHG